MWESRDLTVVILITVASFIFSISVSQLGTLFTGIIGLGFLFIIGHAILISLALLMYQGRRWRFFVQGTLVALLLIPTYGAGTPFDVLARIPMILNSLRGDIIYNSVYGFFKGRNKLRMWAILCAFEFFLVGPFLQMLNMYLFYPPALLTNFVNVILLLFPVIMVETIAGGYLGYKVYERVRKVGWVPDH